MLDNTTNGRMIAFGNVAYTGTAGTLAAGVGTQTRRVMCLCTTAAFLLVGDGTASSSNGMYVPALTLVGPFTIAPGETCSAVQVSSGGTLYVVELA